MRRPMGEEAIGTLVGFKALFRWVIFQQKNSPFDNPPFINYCNFVVIQSEMPLWTSITTEL
jgi:hypothetical protein